MQILSGPSCHTQARQAPLPQHNHDHGKNPNPHHGGGLIPMEAVHIAHDVAMIGMSLPGAHHGHSFDPMESFCGTPPEKGMFDAFTGGTRVHQGLTVMSAAAAAGAPTTVSRCFATGTTPTEPTTWSWVPVAPPWPSRWPQDPTDCIKQAPF